MKGYPQNPHGSKPYTAFLTEVFSLGDRKGQDRLLAERAGEGWEHYESIMIYGNEILLRFRK